MAYNHGVRVLENPTSVTAPITGTAGLQVVFGAAPVNLAEDPYACTNVPILANTFAEAAAAVGYSDDFSDYNICEAIDASFRVAGVGPIVFINVLDPTTHIKDLEEQQLIVTDGQVTVEAKGILADKLVVQHNGSTLTKDEDYIITFDDNGYCVITFLAVLTAASGASVVYVTVSGKVLDPSAINAQTIIGGINSSTGEETGLEVVRQVFPRLGLTPGLIISPGWSADANVAAAMAAKCEGINGVFRCECIVDLDCSATGARKYTDVKDVKNASAMVNKHEDVMWPCARIGSKIYHGSAIKGAYTAFTDAQNDDVPFISPSNIPVAISGICLEDGTEVILDEQQANIVNSYGVSTFNNFSGWTLWGNRTAAYPGSTDPKDMWFCCRRFFSWWGNTFILSYHERVDDPANFRLIEAVVDDENVRGNSLAAQGRCAGAYIEFREEDNTVDDILNGQLQFYQHLAPFTPAEDILNVLEFDPDLLMAAFEGGE